MQRNMLIGVCLAAVIGAPAGAAGDPAEKAIKARRGEMQLRSFYAGPLFAMAKGKMDYDAEHAGTLARNLELLTKLNTGPMWPQGSDNTAYAGKTRALPEVWSTWPAVGDAGTKFKQAVAVLAADADSGLDGLKAGVQALGKSCKGCHDEFRAEEF